ncbi:Cu(I)-responsive transcriptional regulator [Caulobacter sp. AP07]|uniref:Cu(I)-responsive transcriptional regulator n=1 Tax=Caulobacter sp. AP07 TaxID=1144304 RepID=UPI0002721AB3|nr:Cu(I)-responsive transcriptional regulator [Caulobacter sp. AP07]EJL37948.1 Cu(I)-responsive transcriptional regulator [Caulobacter sp. AP07]
MNIGQASKASGVSAKMIRYYEQIKLIAPADRTEGNYRSFSDDEINQLQFIRRARSLGFSVEEIAHLLSLWSDRVRPNWEVKAIADGHVRALEAKVAEIRAMADTLRELSRGCADDERPDCPILADLASGVQPRREPAVSRGFQA